MASRFSRPTNRKSPKKSFLLVCEGETEAAYFLGFKQEYPEQIHIDARVIRADPVQRVREAIALKRTQAKFDQVWCVFDCDGISQEKLDQVLSLARHGGIKVAYTNVCFELWPLLHFSYLEIALPAQGCVNKLSEKLGVPYEKPMASLYGLIRPKQDEALSNAERLYVAMNAQDTSTINPITTVHLLVKEILKAAGRG